MIYGYARVSSKGQSRYGTSLEEQQLTLYGNGAAEIFADSFTGMKTDRPELDKLVAKLQPGDTLMCTKLDRLFRSASKGIEFVDELLARDINVHVLNLGVMNNTPSGKLIRNIFFSFAEFERDMIVERTSEGKEARRAADPSFREGRKRISIDDEAVQKFREKIKKGESTVDEACKELHISRGTWYNRIKELS